MPYRDKVAAKVARRRWYLAHREQAIAQSAKWRRTNAERHLLWRQQNRVRLNEHSRKWYANNKQHVVDYVRQWRAENPEKLNEQRVRYREKHRDEIAERDIRYRKRNKERDKRRSEERRRKLKVEVYAAYGSKCACCSEANIVFLTIDHINNDGSAHRKEVQAGHALHRWLKRYGFPQDRFRLLCWNCNIGRHHNGGICPHQQGGPC